MISLGYEFVELSFQLRFWTQSNFEALYFYPTKIFAAFCQILTDCECDDDCFGLLIKLFSKLINCA